MGTLAARMRLTVELYTATTCAHTHSTAPQTPPPPPGLNPPAHAHHPATQVDPELVDSHYLRPEDQVIRERDEPERLQLLGPNALQEVPESERRALLEEGARWVCDELFGGGSVASKVRQVVEDGVLEVTGDCTSAGVCACVSLGILLCCWLRRWLMLLHGTCTS